MYWFPFFDGHRAVFFPPVVLIGNFVEPQSFSFSKKRGLDSYAGRDEVRRFTSESASAVKKKSDAAHTFANFILVIEMGAGALRGGQPGVEGA